MSAKAVDILKDIFTLGTASLVLIYGMVRVGQLVDSHAITGEAGMVIFVALTSAAAGFLFGTAQGRQTSRAFEKGLLTPTPGDAGTVVTGDNPTVQSGGPTVTGDNVRVSTPTVTRP